MIALESSFPIRRFGALCEVTLGKMLQTSAGGEADHFAPYLKARNITEGGLNLDDMEQMWCSDYERSHLVVEPGDLLVSEGGDVGRSTFAPQSMPVGVVFQNSVHRVRPRSGINIRFMKHALDAVRITGYMDVLCNKATIAHLTHEKLNALLVPSPPKERQDFIADFLDHETAEADRLTLKYWTLIERLEEKRLALITTAVTRGLTLHVPFRDSGVDWIGEIPQHWSVKAMTRCATRVVVGIAEAATHAYVDDGVPILRSTNIRPNAIEGEILHIDPQFANQRESKLIRANDLVTVRTGNAGVTAVLPDVLDGCQCFTMLITTLDRTCVPEFFSYALNSQYGRHFFALEAWGTAQANISVPILKAFQIAVPPTDEQRDIVSHLSRELLTIDNTIKQTRRAIELIGERRSALIMAAVTGLIDVRNHRSEKLPAEVNV